MIHTFLPYLNLFFKKEENQIFLTSVAQVAFITKGIAPISPSRNQFLLLSSSLVYATCEREHPVIFDHISTLSAYSGYLTGSLLTKWASEFVTANKKLRHFIYC